MDSRLVEAFEQRDLIEMRRLIERGASVHARNKDGWPLLCMASSKGWEREVDVLLQHGADANIPTWDGWKSLMAAANENQESIVKKLIDKNADVNAQNENGWTALMDAALHGFVNIVKILLVAGADATTTNKWNETALDYAKRNGHFSTVNCLGRWMSGDHSVAEDAITPSNETRDLSASNLLPLDQSELPQPSQPVGGHSSAFDIGIPTSDSVMSHDEGHARQAAGNERTGGGAGGQSACSLSEAELECGVTEIQMLEVSKVAGTKWSEIGLHLGFELSEFENYRVKHPDSLDKRLLDLLAAWKMRETRATVGMLLAACRKAKVGGAVEKAIQKHKH